MADPTWEELVDVARWAPSPHNMQPWKVRVLSATEAELLADPSRLLPETDPDGAFMTVGLGIFVESLAVAAHARGRELDVELAGDVDPRATAPTTFARLRLVARTVEDALSPQLVLDRRTSRVAYDGRPVEP